MGLRSELREPKPDNGGGRGRFSKWTLEDLEREILSQQVMAIVEDFASDSQVQRMELLAELGLEVTTRFKME